MIRRFHFERLEDESGVSGTGKVAEGIIFSNGVTVISWLSHLTSVTVYQSVDACKSVHSHSGKTIIIYEDPDENEGELPENLVKKPTTLPPNKKKK